MHIHLRSLDHVYMEHFLHSYLLVGGVLCLEYAFIESYACCQLCIPVSSTHFVCLTHNSLSPAACLTEHSLLLLLFCMQVLTARTTNKARAARPGPRFMAGSAAFCMQVLTARTTNKARAARPGPRFMAGSAAEERELMCTDLDQVRSS